MGRSVRKADFLSLDEMHPYGVLPGGNRFFGASNIRSEEVFADTIWQQILSFFDAKMLGSIVQSSHYFYVAGHQPELWRDLVLRQCFKEKKTIRAVRPSWRDTYLALFVKDSGKDHSPIPVSGVYSDEYYRTHLCRSFAIPSAWCNDSESSSPSSPNEVPRVAVEDISPEQFFEEYEMKNMPVIIEGAAKGMALNKWRKSDYLQQNVDESTTFRATSGAAPLPATFELKAYEEYGKFSYLEESPLYLFDRTAFASNNQWSNDFFPEFYEKCPFWDPAASHGHDLLQHLGAERRPDHTWMIMGPKRSGSVFHLDPNCTHAWNACIEGRKRWIFYPPGVNPPGIFPSEDGDEVALPLSVGEWLMQYWEEHTKQYRSRPPHERPMECTVGPGDVIFVPHGWWHSVINLDDRNIAITHNYVSPSNLGNVLKFFTAKQDQISGCRDRKESVKPEHLYDELVNALKEKEPKHLEKALEQKDWTCRTWKDEPAKSAETLDCNHISGKRKHEAITSTAEPKSVMAKTEKIEAFSFSFL
ncbi:unnamed protein product [Cylindrotheca closterium]|uniref:JmjC domain-containing protein n=1 Tax=Cylindrotheca closterium TaxID=2856 RepID=A0AAD2FMP0_9STRA|nr:unnamed protein product [Cylindrotheca closterium]